MNKLKQNPKSLLKEVSSDLSTGKEFSFWKHLNKLEKIAPHFSEKVNGVIEENVTVKGRLFLGKGSIIKSGTYIEGNVFIDKNCEIGPFAFIKKQALIGNGSKIGRADISNSIFLEKAYAKHFSYVGDSILGKNTNLGAGTKLANYRFDEATISSKISGKKIDSGRKKLGCVLGNNSKTGINVSINCGVQIGKNCLISPGAYVKNNLSNRQKFP